MRSARRCSSRPRSAALIFGQGPSSNALRAALTARSTSALSPSATWQIVSPVVGFRVGKVLPLTLSTQRPPMSIGWSLNWGGLIVRGLGAVAVAMRVVLRLVGEKRVPPTLYGGGRPVEARAGSEQFLNHPSADAEAERRHLLAAQPRDVVDRRHQVGGRPRLGV